MEIILCKKEILINQGFVNITKSSSQYSIRYDKNEPIAVNQGGNICFIESRTEDACMSISIGNLNESKIEVTTGVIETCAVAKRLCKNKVNTGAIEINIEKEQIGELDMQVASGIIVANDSTVKITQIYPHGFQAHFQGKLKNQKTCLFVEVGVILCKIK